MLRMVVLLCAVTVVSSTLFDKRGFGGFLNAIDTSVRKKISGLLSKDPVPAYVNEVEEDARLNVAQLLQKNHYPVETHHVTTSDGYILELHRVPHGITSNGTASRPVVFLMHGFLSSSADWVVTGPGKGLTYILAEEGFDVWMGNARGNTYSRRHTSLNPDRRWLNYLRLQKSFWDFSWDEIGNIDVPAMIDHVLERTGRRKLHYIGHSQGTTAFFVMCSLRPSYNDKIISMHALAPVAFMAHNKNPLLRHIAPFSNKIRRLASVIGIDELVSSGAIMSWAGQALCHDQAITQILCSNIFFLIGGWNMNQHNATILPSIISHTPAGASVKQLAHYGQSLASGGFRRYDYGFIMNKFVYNSMQPPDYNLSQVTAPVYLHYSASDPMAEVPDVDRLWREIGRPSGKFLISMESFSHLDFLWGNDAKVLVYDKVIDIMWDLDDHVRPNVQTGRNVW